MSDGVLLWQVACEFLAGSRKLAHLGFTSRDAWNRLHDLRRLMPLVPPTPDILTQAEALANDGQLHFWDALIFAACLGAGVTRLYTEDVPGTRIHGLTFINPFQ